MQFDLIPFVSGAIQKQAVHEILQCNDYTEPFGLVLTQDQAVELVETRTLSLKNTGRIEFGGGVIDKLIKAFCDSPYLIKQNYAQTLHELTELFYYYKNETLDLTADDDLIQFMKSSFDGICQGALALLDRELHQMAANLRFSRPADFTEDLPEKEEEDEDA